MHACGRALEGEIETKEWMEKGGEGRGLEERAAGAVKHSDVEHVTTSEIGRAHRIALSPGKLRRPTDCLSFRYEIIPDWPQEIRGQREREGEERRGDERTKEKD